MLVRCCHTGAARLQVDCALSMRISERHLVVPPSLTRTGISVFHQLQCRMAADSDLYVDARHVQMYKLLVDMFMYVVCLYVRTHVHSRYLRPYIVAMPINQLSV